jgi:hypothetical protein
MRTLSVVVVAVLLASCWRWPQTGRAAQDVGVVELEPVR